MSRLLRLCALLPTPVLLCIWTSNSHYLDNQGDLGYEAGILLPYLLAALALWVCGACLAHASRPWAQLALHVYILAGPFYFAYRVLKHLYWQAREEMLPFSVEIAVSFLALATILWAALALRRREFPLRGWQAGLALAGVALVAIEAHQFATRVVAPEHAPSLRAALAAPPPDSQLPNVYHLILDGFQTEMFEQVFPEATRERDLPQFHYFPDNTAPYGRTRFSIPSTFLGTRFDEHTSQLAFVHAAFSAGQSFLAVLKAAGYRTFGLLSFPREAEEPLLDRAPRHGEYIGLQLPDNARTFAHLWLVTNFPQWMAEIFVPQLEVQDLQHQKVISAPEQILGVRALEQLLALEPDLPERGRYTLVHVLVPHPPATLDARCQQQHHDAPSDQAYAAHIACAAHLIRSLTTRLRQLDRYEDSLIVIHGDHGFYADFREGHLVDTAADSRVDPDQVKDHDAFARLRSRALLLIKPPRSRSPSPGFTRSDAPTTLLDVAPTVLDSLGLPLAAGMEGYSLLSASAIPSHRRRSYCFYDFVRIDDIRMLAEELTCWEIDHGRWVRQTAVDLRPSLPHGTHG